MANLCALNLPATETITAAQYDSLRTDVDQYLNDNQLANQVLGILLGYRVPGYVDTDGQGTITPTSDLLHSNSAAFGITNNPLGLNQTIERPTTSNVSGLRLTARIDGPTLDDAKAIVDLTTDLLTNGLGDGATSTIWLDPYTTPGPNVDSFIAAMANWSASLDAMRTRLPLMLSTTAQSCPVSHLLTVGYEQSSSVCWIHGKSFH